ncbi:branched-chain amino acid transport system II carrier protein [Macrococcus equipercicus]|uniref:Branched-chain amino acid transport system carrier protein n=1 Tax=Macrococcus equipercicus TaxID=69967 RepID=A0ABQ6R6W2_9STAP|nr:branched-chain amino acid transport system II carrier protein [Macrococcus equipercicus]KAA1037601.1 branched-chain amino acid transport system II carrier protein [Macrococcus equipercicus]
MNKTVVVSGLMLFSLFFGAGNLIFPPMLGYTAGQHLWIAMLGFVVTGILLPLLTVIITAYYDEGVEGAGNKVHPVFGLIFAIVIYLSIGALYGIPRAANVAYEIGVKSIFPAAGYWLLIVFSLLFFILVYIIALNPSKMAATLGKVLTPVLLFVIALLSLFTIMHPERALQPAHGKYIHAPFVSGLLEGYFTMDLVAALAFSVVVVNSFKYAGITDKKQIVISIFKAGIISSSLLLLIYLSLAYMGGTSSAHAFKDGTDILTYQSLRNFGSLGNLLFAAIVLLACLTTCIGLVNACAEFFHKIYGKISYQRWALIFSVMGFCFTTLGLETILSLAVPLLIFIYPVSIVLVLLSCVQVIIKGRSKYLFILPAAVTLLFSVLQIIAEQVGWFHGFYNMLPLSSLGLAWLVPFMIFSFIGFIMDRVIPASRVAA